MTEIAIKYDCIATPPDNISMCKKYYYGIDAKGTYYSDGKNVVYADLDLIKMLFVPRKGTWDSIVKKETKNTEK